MAWCHWRQAGGGTPVRFERLTWGTKAGAYEQTRTGGGKARAAKACKGDHG